MSQLTALREIDDMLDEAFRAAGLADDGSYTAPTLGAPAVDCVFLVDRVVRFDGGEVRARSGYVLITVKLADVTPVPGGYFSLGSETFTVDAVTDQDESRAICLCKVGT